MTGDSVSVERVTKETKISLVLDMGEAFVGPLAVGIPFFEHLLRAMAFHGGFDLRIEAAGDTDVDAHHLVEDIGLVLGDALRRHVAAAGSVSRYGHAVIPMDDAASEVTIDACGRPYLVFLASFPQPSAGAFDISLVREFLLALANRAQMNVHAHIRYGENSHHMAESLFKALGIALKSAYRPISSDVRSTKGVLETADAPPKMDETDATG